MGQSSDAHLLYGIKLEMGEYLDFLGVDENSFDYQDWDKVYADKLGIKQPIGEYRGNEQVFSKYWKEVREIVKASGVSIETYGYMDSDIGERSIFIFYTDFHCAAYSYDSEIVNMPSHSLLMTALDKLYKFCKVTGIKYRDPKWYLVADYG